MEIVFSIGMGMVIVFLALHLIKKEVMKASFFKNVQKQSSSMTLGDNVVDQVQRLEQVVDEMNQSFYDIVSDLEGHYSLHEKEIEGIVDKIQDLSRDFEDLSRSVVYQSKALQSYSVQNESQSKTGVEPPVADLPPKDSSAYKEVMHLKALGYDDQQIAKRMHKGIREIKMLTKLKK